MPRADLHVHTTHSDGACTPGDVVRSAAAVGLTALAITDHDTVSALPSARAEAERLRVELVPGIELTAEHESREVHILGYFFREDDEDLIRVTDALRLERSERIQRMAERLRSLGRRVDLEAIRRTFPRANLGRKHLADWLTLTKQVPDVRSAFELYLDEGKPAFVPKARLHVNDAVSLIKNAGGVAGLAHPPFNMKRATLDELVGHGLEAIEIDGPGIKPRLGERWAAWGTELDLIPVAGSDFHVPDRPGRWVGSITASMETVERLRLRASGRPTG